MQACLTVGLLLLATMSGHGPSRVMRLPAGPLAASASALRQTGYSSQPQRELRDGLSALHALLPHPLLLLGLNALQAAALDLPQPAAHQLAVGPVRIMALGASPRRLLPARAP